jgi:hypothetical protein
VSETPTADKNTGENKQKNQKRRTQPVMSVGRVIGRIFMISAIAILVRDVLATTDDGALSLIAAGELWFSLHPTSLQVAEPAIARHVPVIGPWLWHPLISTLLTWPALLVTGVPGVLLVWLFRRRPPKGGMFR